MGVDGQRHAFAALLPGKRPGTHCVGGWVGPRGVLDICENSCPHRDSIPGPSIPYKFAILPELPGPIRNILKSLRPSDNYAYQQL
jgi:hypothetical protein